MGKIAFFSSLFCFFLTNSDTGEVHREIRDESGRSYRFIEYRGNELIEYDQYKKKQEEERAFEEAVIDLFSKGVAKALVVSRDKKVGRIMKHYSFDAHHHYMAKILESKKIDEGRKAPLIALFTDYQSYRKKLDRDFLKKIHEIGKPKILANLENLDLSETPFIKNSLIEEWVFENYENRRERGQVLDLIYEYKTNRFQSDLEFNTIYFNILKSE